MKLQAEAAAEVAAIVAADAASVVVDSADPKWKKNQGNIPP